MTEVESKFIIMARIAVELNRKGFKCNCFIDGGDAFIVYGGEFIADSLTEQELLDWLEDLQENNNDKA